MWNVMSDPTSKRISSRAVQPCSVLCTHAQRGCRPVPGLRAAAESEIIQHEYEVNINFMIVTGTGAE
jgi:hypothetical protein